MNDLEGRQAMLKTPHNGYRNIILLEKSGSKWLAEICGSGKIIEVYDDEVVVN